MPLLSFVIWVAIIGFVVWAVITFIPMPDQFKRIVVGVAIVGVVLWAVYMFLPGGGPWIGRHP